MSGITPTQLSFQVGHLKERYTIVTLSQYLTQSFTAPVCVLTFDDGLKDHYEHVCPVLAQHGVPGTFFSITGTLETPHTIMEVHKVHLLLASAGSGEIGHALNRLFRECYPALLEQFEIRDDVKRDPRYRFDDAWTANVKYATRHLPQQEKEVILGELFGTFVGNEADHARSLYVNDEELKKMEQAGHEIASHGHRHREFTTISDDEVTDDITRAHTMLARILGHAPRTFSYPFGSSTDVAAATLARNGYYGAVTTTVGENSHEIQPFLLQRINTVDIPLGSN